MVMKTDGPQKNNIDLPLQKTMIIIKITCEQAQMLSNQLAHLNCIPSLFHRYFYNNSSSNQYF